MLVRVVSVQRHVALLRGELRSDEQERRWIRAERLPQGHAGALLLTDRRLLFSGLGFVAQSQEAWPLAVLAAARLDGAVLELRLGGRTERFAGRAKDLAALAADLPTGPTESEDAGLAGELERLARLREEGALSEAEFAAAKRRLLS